MKINKNLLLDAVYPVGSIYMSVNSINPSTLFGGTWQQWGSGKVPVGIDENDTDFDTVEATGGEKTHTLTTNEIPSHKHTIKDKAGPTGSGTFYGSSTGSVGGYATENTGGGEAHNNLQPYITCYMWKRTA